MITREETIDRSLTGVFRSRTEEVFEATDSSFGVASVYWAAFLQLDGTDFLQLATHTDDPRLSFVSSSQLPELAHLLEIERKACGATISDVKICPIGDSVYFELSNCYLLWYDYDEYGTTLYCESAESPDRPKLPMVSYWDETGE